MEKCVSCDLIAACSSVVWVIDLSKNVPFILRVPACRTLMSLSQNRLVQYFHGPIHLLLSVDMQVWTILQLYAAFHQVVKR